MFSVTYWNQPVSTYMCPSVYKILVSVNLLGGGGIKSHIATALVLPVANTWLDGTIK